MRARDARGDYDYAAHGDDADDSVHSVCFIPGPDNHRGCNDANDDGNHHSDGSRHISADVPDSFPDSFPDGFPDGFPRNFFPASRNDSRSVRAA